MQRALPWLVMACLLAGCASAPLPAAKAEAVGGFSFALWGDMPYKRNGDDPGLKATIASMNAADIAFSIHDGDVKDGGSRCDDVVYTDALALFNRLQAPAIYTPGDNEWTDCHRLSNREPAIRAPRHSLRDLQHARQQQQPGGGRRRLQHQERTQGGRLRG
jgi:hypothetical protein